MSSNPSLCKEANSLWWRSFINSKKHLHGSSEEETENQSTPRLKSQLK